MRADKGVEERRSATRLARRERERMKERERRRTKVHSRGPTGLVLLFIERARGSRLLRPPFACLSPAEKYAPVSPAARAASFTILPNYQLIFVLTDAALRVRSLRWPTRPRKEELTLHPPSFRWRKIASQRDRSELSLDSELCRSSSYRGFRSTDRAELLVIVLRCIAVNRTRGQTRQG